MHLVLVADADHVVVSVVLLDPPRVCERGQTIVAESLGSFVEDDWVCSCSRPTLSWLRSP